MKEIFPDVLHIKIKFKFKLNWNKNLSFKSRLSSCGLNETDIACCCTFQSPGSYLIEHWELINLIATQTHNLFYGWKIHVGCMVIVRAYCSKQLMQSKTRRNKYRRYNANEFIPPENLLSIKQYWTVQGLPQQKAPILLIFQYPGRCIGFLEEKLWN